MSESDATTVTVVASAGSDPVLLTAPGRGVSLAFATVHSDDRNDPLNGLAIASRSPDGSWSSAPVVATGMTSSCGIAGLLLPDGSPLLAANAADCQGVFPVHGSTLLGDADMIQYAPENEAMNLALARDGRGHVWVAWYTEFQGIVMRALNGSTGEPIGQDHVAPDSLWPTNNVGRVALVCKPAAPGCRVVYKAHFGSRIVSWAPHSGPAQVLVTADAGISLGTVAAVYRGDGRLWLAWIDHPNFNRQSLHFTLASDAGRRAPIYRVPTPQGSVPARLSLQPIGRGLLLLASVPTTPAQVGPGLFQFWVDHVTPRAGLELPSRR